MNYDTAKKEYKKLISRKKYEYKILIQNQISRTKETNQFWKLINGFKCTTWSKDYIDLETQKLL